MFDEPGHARVEAAQRQQVMRGQDCYQRGRANGQRLVPGNSRSTNDRAEGHRCGDVDRCPLRQRAPR